MTTKNAVHLYEGKLHALPEEVDYNPKKVIQLDNLLKQLIESEKLQCASYLLSRHGKIFAYKSMGKLTYKNGSKDFMPDSIRRIASTTKFFTSVAIMKLIEDGKLYLDQSVSTIIDEFDTAQHRGINIFHLLTHTSGLCADSGYFNEAYPSGWPAPEPGKNWIKGILTGPLHCNIGEQWNYSSRGFSLLGEIISRVSGMDYEDYILTSITKPLGMDRTFFTISENLSDEICFVHEEEEAWQRSQKYQPGMPPRAGGGLYSTLLDLWKFGQTMLDNGNCNGEQLLSRKSIETMTRNQLQNVYAYCWGAKTKSISFGLGLSHDTRDILTKTVYGHEGAGRCGLWIDKEESFVAAYFVPTSSDWVPESVINTRNIMWSGLL